MFLLFNFVYLFLAVLGLHCDAGFSRAAQVGTSLLAVHGSSLPGPLVSWSARAMASGAWLAGSGVRTHTHSRATCPESWPVGLAAWGHVELPPTRG